MSARARARILTSSQWSNCVFNLIFLGSLVCMLKFKVMNRSSFLLQEYASNALNEYQAFVDDVNMLSRE